MDEMMDAGFPYTTDLNQLEGLIAPSTALTKVVSVVAGGSSQTIRNDGEPDPVTRFVSAVAGTSTTTQLAAPSQNIWWRRTNVEYAANEVYADVMERIDCIVDSSGSVAMGGICGEIMVTSKLSGATPECRLAIRDPDMLKGACFHPCVDMGKFRQQNALSFIPPDGTFTLCSYWIRDTMQSFPLTISGNLGFHEDMGKLKLTIQPRLSVFQKTSAFLDRCQFTIQLPNSIAGCNIQGNTGQWKFDSSSKLLHWTIGKMPDSPSSLEGTLSYLRDENGQLCGPQEEKCSCQVVFSVKGWVMSGMKLDCLDVSNTTYTPYKACRYATQSGKIEVRLL